MQLIRHFVSNVLIKQRDATTGTQINVGYGKMRLGSRNGAKEDTEMIMLKDILVEKR